MGQVETDEDLRAFLNEWDLNDWEIDHGDFED